MPGIYTIRNIVTGRIYVGRSTGVETRWKQHRYKLNCGRHTNKALQHDWNEQGESAFVFEILEEIPLQRSYTFKLVDRESYYISLFRRKGLVYNE